MSELPGHTFYEIGEMLVSAKEQVTSSERNCRYPRESHILHTQLESARNKAKRREPALFRSLIDGTFTRPYKYSLDQTLSIFEELARIAQTKVRNRERIRAQGVTKEIVTKAELCLLKSTISK